MLLWLMNLGFAGSGVAGPSGPPAYVVQFRDSRRRLVLLPLIIRLLGGSI